MNQIDSKANSIVLMFGLTNGFVGEVAPSRNAPVSR